MCGPVNVASLTGKKYMITFTNDKTRRSDVMYMTQKSQALECFKEYQAMVEGPIGEQIRILYTDRGGEYVGKVFKRYLMSQQIDHEETDAESPEQNGVAERLNRTVMDKARAMVAHMGLCMGFWAEAVNPANYLRNRSPCQSLKGHITPLEAWHGKKPDIAHLCTFGCIAYARVPDRKRTKLTLVCFISGQMVTLRLSACTWMILLCWQISCKKYWK